MKSFSGITHCRWTLEPANVPPHLKLLDFISNSVLPGKIRLCLIVQLSLKRKTIKVIL